MLFLKTKSIISLVASIFLFSCNTNSQQQTESDTSNVSSSDVKKVAVQNIDQAKFLELQTTGGAVVIDVRTPEEVSEGYIKGANKFININGENFAQEILALDKSKTYIVYCRSGARSGRAAQYMIENGFNTVCNLEGGIMNWKGEIAK